MKTQPSECEKIFANGATDKGLISKIYKQLSKKKQTTQSKKWVEDLNDISSKKTYRWPTNTWKDSQHQSLWEKCISKLQWDITSHQSEWLSSKTLQTINFGEDV